MQKQTTRPIGRPLSFDVCMTDEDWSELFHASLERGDWATDDTVAHIIHVWAEMRRTARAFPFDEDFLERSVIGQVLGETWKTRPDM
jgi:hypothetical protein